MRKIKIIRLDPEKIKYMEKKLKYEGMSFQAFAVFHLFKEGWRNEMKKLEKMKL